MSLSPNKGELLMALAEYLRNDESFEIEYRKEIRQVVGYQEDTVTEWAGCPTCRYERVSVIVYYETWDGELAHLTIDESFGALIAELEATVNDYGQGSQYSNMYGGSQ